MSGCIPKQVSFPDVLVRLDDDDDDDDAKELSSPLVTVVVAVPKVREDFRLQCKEEEEEVHYDTLT